MDSALYLAFVIPGASQLHSEMWPSQVTPMQTAFTYGLVLWSIHLTLISDYIFNNKWHFFVSNLRCLATLPFFVLSSNIFNWPTAIIWTCIIVTLIYFFVVFLGSPPADNIYLGFLIFFMFLVIVSPGYESQQSCFLVVTIKLIVTKWLTY